jgi:TetR/AcrR family transcriptional regulator
VTEATRAQLLEAGRVLFAGQGLEGARVEGIAREAGVNKALINYHFRGKAGLYERVLAELFDAVGRDLDRALAPLADPRRRLLAWPAALWEVLGRHRDFAPLLLRELAARGDGDRGRRLAGAAPAFPLLAGTLAQAEAAGALARPADPFALQLLLLGSLVLARSAAPLREALAAAGGPRGDEAAVVPLLERLMERSLLEGGAQDPER